MEVNKLNDLGVFDTIEAIWKRYPEGGRDGDYATIGEQECYWDKFLLSWVGVGIEREKSARGSHTFGGDVVVNNDLRIGGTLYAANVRQPNCGLFPTLEALKKVHPNPTAGMWAYVGTTIPSPVHRCDVDGVWNEEGEVATSKISAEVLDEITGQIGSKLSKTTADTANEHITFAKGLTTLNAIVRELASVKQLSVTDVANITKAVINGEIKSNDYSNTDGFKIFKGANGWNIEIDHITARKTFKTLELVVQRVVHQGGMIIQSPAGGKIERVESEDANHYYVKVTNAEQFRAGDLVLCQRFTGRSTKRYWRRVVGSNATHMFISKTDCEAESGAVEVGDEIAVLGSKSNRERRCARVICMIGANSPYVADYAGIDNYTLQGKLINQIGNLSGVNDPDFGGNLEGVGLYTKNLYANGNIRLKSGESVESYTETAVGNAKAELSRSIGTAVDGLKRENESKYVTKSVHSSDIQETSNLISQKVSRQDFNALGDRVSSAESSITQKANEIRIEVTSAIDGAKTEARQNISTAVNNAKTELTDSITAEALRQVKAGIKVETGKLTLFGREVSVLGSAHFHSLDGKINSKMTTSTYIDGGKIKTSMLKVEEILASQILTDKLNAREVSILNAFVQKLRTEELIAQNIRVRDRSEIGVFELQDNSLYSSDSNAHIMIEDESFQRFAKLSNYTSDPVLHLSNKTGLPLLVEGRSGRMLTTTNRHEYLALHTHGGVRMQMHKNHYWSVPGVLCSMTLTYDGKIRNKWGDGVKIAEAIHLGQGGYKVKFRYGTEPQVYHVSLTPHTMGQYPVFASIETKSSDEFTYSIRRLEGEGNHSRFQADTEIVITGIPNEELND